MRNKPLKGLIKRSPIKTKTTSFAPSSQRRTSYTGSGSEYKSKDTIVSRNIDKVIPKNTPSGIISAVAGGGLIRNLGKAAKIAKQAVSSFAS
tara:strand:+ start:37 stop:312 length:276 start_codon:yes stop_codon:yes gene_type:complete